MSLREQITADLKEAMKSGDALRRTVIRGLVATIRETEQRNREELVKKALQKHNVPRPIESDPVTSAEYEKAVQAVIARENVEAKSTLDEAGILTLVQRLVKQRQESIADAERAGRDDLASAEQREIEVLEAYLPQQMSREEIEAEARALIAEVGASDPRDMGRVMGPLMEKLKGRADGKLISEVVRALLAG